MGATPLYDHREYLQTLSKVPWEQCCLPHPCLKTTALEQVFSKCSSCTGSVSRAGGGEGEKLLEMQILIPHFRLNCIENSGVGRQTILMHAEVRTTALELELFLFFRKNFKKQNLCQLLPVNLYLLFELLGYYFLYFSYE